MDSNSRKSVFIELLITWLIVIIGGKLAMWGAPWIPGLNEYSGFILSALLIYAPLLMYYRNRQRIDFISFKKIGKSWMPFLIASFAVFPAAALLVWLIPGLTFLNRPPLEDSYFLFYQLVAVAFPEEFFFRGYMQERLNRVWAKKYSLFGVSFGPALLVASLIFALSHSVIAFQGWHILIFFPSLLFGLLREKTGQIWASLLFHAACNMLSYHVEVRYPLF